MCLKKVTSLSITGPLGDILTGEFPNMQQEYQSKWSLLRVQINVLWKVFEPMEGEMNMGGRNSKANNFVIYFLLGPCHSSGG
jgi:hypothetical protein